MSFLYFFVKQIVQFLINQFKLHNLYDKIKYNNTASMDFIIKKEKTNGKYKYDCSLWNEL